MMKKTFKLASLTFLMFGCAVASEFRPALNLERGPQRYDLVNEKNDKEAWDIDLWSIMYSRNGNKAFGKHGTKTNPLSALIFGKSDFTASEALPQSLTTATTQEFNVNLNSTKLTPRVTYDEKGVNLGASVGYRVMSGKGKLGVKFNVPVKTVRMERDNNAETVEQGSGQATAIFGDVSAGVVVPVSHPAGQPAAGANNSVLYVQTLPTVSADLYKLSAVKNLPFARGAGQTPFMYHNAGANRYELAGQSYATNPAGVPTAAEFGGLPERADIPFVIFSNPDPRQVPIIAARAIKLPPALVGSNDAIAGGAADAPVAISTAVIGAGVGIDVPTSQRVLQGTVIAAEPVGGAAVHTTPIANFHIQATVAPNPVNNHEQISHMIVNGAAEAPLAVQEFGALTTLDAAAIGGAPVPNTLYAIPGNIANAAPYEAWFEQYKDNLWLMTVSAADGRTKINPGQNEQLKISLQRYASESAEQWLFRNGYTMATNQRTGLGDITVNPYYDHSFSRAWNGGVYAHVSIPTGGSRRMGENPYKARLGNDNHFELGGGANVAWQAFDWMNVRLDAMAAYALPAKERIAIPCKDATVRALGPTIDADIDYTRIKASLDSTFVHPRTSSLATTIGYDFEFKTKDNVSLKSKDYTFKNLADDKDSWFGGTWDNVAGGFRAKTIALDPAVQARNTESISHQFRMETSWKATRELSLFWGASSTPFGQNAMKATTVYGGMSVDF